MRVLAFATAMTYLLAGLGNIGLEYANTRPYSTTSRRVAPPLRTK